MIQPMLRPFSNVLTDYTNLPSHLIKLLASQNIQDFSFIYFCFLLMNNFAYYIFSSSNTLIYFIYHLSPNSLGSSK